MRAYEAQVAFSASARPNYHGTDWLLMYDTHELSRQTQQLRKVLNAPRAIYSIAAVTIFSDAVRQDLYGPIQFCPLYERRFGTIIVG